MEVWNIPLTVRFLEDQIGPYAVERFCWSWGKEYAGYRSSALRPRGGGSHPPQRIPLKSS